MTLGMVLSRSSRRCAYVLAVALVHPRLSCPRVRMCVRACACLQVEPGGLSTASQLRNFETRYWLFHYTYQASNGRAAGRSLSFTH
eukprot:6198764-Pleurochrysis_carterae.AAC.2